MDQHLLNTISKHLSQGDFTQAFELLKGVADTHVNDAQYWELLALTHGMSGNNLECKNACIRAIKLNANNIGTYINLGVAQQNLGLLEEAEITLKKALALDSNHPQVQNNLGAIYILKSEHIKAKPYIEKAITLQPDYSDAHSNLGEIHKYLQNDNKAIESFSKSISLNKNNINAHLGIGILYANIVRYDESEQHLKYALQLNPNHSEILFNLGFLHYQKKDHDKAAKYFKKTVAIAPDHYNAKYLLSAITGEAVPNQSPEVFVKGLFDHYADNFDEHLTKNLHYQTPSLMHSVFSEYAKPATTKILLDLGCGTGISGEKFCEQYDHLIGIDLSENMLAKAKEKTIYNELHAQDIASYLTTTTNDNHDLVIASDVFVYIGDIAELVKMIYEKQSDSGYFIFSIEQSFQHETFHLRRTGRYSHNIDYIKSILENASYKIVTSISTVIRKEKGVDINGVVYLSQKVT